MGGTDLRDLHHVVEHERELPRREPGGGLPDSGPVHGVESVQALRRHRCDVDDDAPPINRVPRAARKAGPFEAIKNGRGRAGRETALPGQSACCPRFPVLKQSQAPQVGGIDAELRRDASIKRARQGAEFP